MTTTTSTSGISGLSSGIDTSSLITKLMAVAAAPQTLLKNKLTLVNSQVSALQGLNTSAAALATSAKALAAPTGLTTLSATSTSTATTAVVNGSPTSGSLTFDVSRLAAAHSVLTDAVSDPGDGSTPSVTITASDGTKKTVDAASWSARDIAAAVSGAGLGVSATTISNGSRLLLTSASTGDASAFSVTIGAKQPDGTAADSVRSTVLQQGQDAQLTLGDGSTIGSATNTFTGLMTGVDVTVSKVESGTTVSVGSDATSATKQVSALVTQLNALVGSIASATTSTPGASGSKGTSSPLSGNYQVSSLRQALLTTIGSSADAAAAGISVDRDGNATFDESTFSSYLAANPSRAQSVVSGLAGRVAAVATAASDPYSGSLSQMISADKTTASSLTSSIADWDTRLALRQQTLTSQFTAMETALSTLQSQSSALTASLANL